MVNKIEHIGIAVADLQATLGKYSDLLGLEVSQVEEVEVEGVDYQIAFLPINGINIELVHPKGDTGLVADFLKKHGEGIHHIAFEVDKLEQRFEQLREDGVNFVWDKIVAGSRDTRVAFFEPQEFQGTYIELIEKQQQE